MSPGDGYSPAKEARVGQVVTESVDARAHVSRRLGASVNVVGILGNEVDVVEYEAVKVARLAGFDEARVEEFGAIELPVGALLDHKDAVIEALRLEKGVDVVDENLELSLALPVAQDYRYLEKMNN